MLRPRQFVLAAWCLASLHAQGPSAWYDTSNRAAVRDAWTLTWWPTNFVPTGWNGSVDANIPGTTTPAFRNAVLTRINWFRAMAGVPPGIVLDPMYNAWDQQAALMFSANRAVSHTPPTNWIGYTQEAATAASHSNACFGFSNDAGCLLTYILDLGLDNRPVGHRRWLLYPQTRTMGTGDVPPSGLVGNPYPAANALWVMDGLSGTERPATRDGFVAWPPPGYVPYQVVGGRWSFSYPNADFTLATVAMQRNGTAVPVRIESATPGFGENTLVWAPDKIDTSVYLQLLPPAADVTSTVTIGNVQIDGVFRSFTYSVTVFDPDPAPGAAFTLSPDIVHVPAAGGPGTATLTVTPAASWSAAAGNDWVSVATPAGTGSGPVSWIASANLSTTPRVTTLRAGTATLQLQQEGASCTYTFSPPSATLSTAGGAGSVTVTAVPTDCNMNYAITGDLAVNGTFTGLGVLALSFGAGANTTSVARLFTIQFGGSVFTITQPPGFLDVSPSDYFFPAVNLLRQSNITAGCSSSPPLYCPNDPVTRAQMAIFLVRAVLGSDVFSYATSPHFADVPSGVFGFPWIQKLYELGITAGCGSALYCPNDSVTRGQMAAFVTRARLGATADGTFSYPATPYFTDVPAGHQFFPWIQRLRSDLITAGCGDGSAYCPNDPVTRGQMAVFLARGTFNQMLPAGSPVISSLSPAAVTAGQNTTLTITGVNTHFTQDATLIDAGPGIVVSNLSVAGPTSLTVQLAPAANAARGPRTITATTGAELALVPNGLTVQ